MYVSQCRFKVVYRIWYMIAEVLLYSFELNLNRRKTLLETYTKEWHRFSSLFCFITLFFHYAFELVHHRMKNIFPPSLLCYSSKRLCMSSANLRREEPKQVPKQNHNKSVYSNRIMKAPDIILLLYLIKKVAKTIIMYITRFTNSDS